MNFRNLFAVTAGVMMTLAVGCGRDGDLRLEKIADGFSRPLFVTSEPNNPSRLFVVEQNTGRIKVVEDGTVLAAPFLDIGEKVDASGLERGLLGFALHPDYDQNGRFFVNYTASGAGDTDFSIIEEYIVSDDPVRADPDSAIIILSFQQPTDIHNGGMIAFGPDGYLYIATGDGGGANDPDNRAQSLDTLLGKILRIEVDGEAPYTIPEDNPFVGVPGAREEIWAYGLRNPWRFSFDRETGDMYVGDVGERAREEINFEPFESNGGLNYGWRVREGSICRPGEQDCAIEGAIAPIYEYEKTLSAAVTGGYVYRGNAIPWLRGYYLFADWSSGQVWSFRYEDDEVRFFQERKDIRPPGLFPTISSFGEDADGELYIVGWLAGAVYKIVPNETLEE